MTTTLHPGTIHILSLATCLVVDALVEVGSVVNISSTSEDLDWVSEACLGGDAGLKSVEIEGVSGAGLEVEVGSTSVVRQGVGLGAKAGLVSVKSSGVCFEAEAALALVVDGGLRAEASRLIF